MTEFLAPLHLIAEQSSIAQAWVEGLDRIREKVSGMTSAQRHTWWLWDKFKSADKDGNGQLEAKEVKKFFKSINLEMNDNNFRDLFAKYDKNKSNRYKLFPQTFFTKNIYTNHIIHTLGILGSYRTE